MKVDIAILLAAALAALPACSTVQSRRDQPPVFEQTTSTSLKAFAGCFSDKTAKQDVQYLPRPNGATFSSGAGPQHFVFWVVDVDDLGDRRIAKVYAVNGPTARNMAIPAVKACS
jgi:hypothetical protein